MTRARLGLPAPRRVQRPDLAVGSLVRANGRGLLAMSACFALLVWGAWRPAWSADETATVMVVRRSWWEVLRTFWYDPALGPYYTLMRAWAAVSTSHLWLRLPSVLAMCGVVAVLWGLTRRLRGRRAAALTCLIFLLLPATSSFGQDARPYALAVLLVVLLVAEWIRIEQRPRRAATVRVTVLIVLGALAHPYALAVVPALLVGSLLAGDEQVRRDRWQVTSRATVLALLLVSPFLLLVATRAGGQPNPATLTAVHVAETAARMPVERLSVTGAVALAALVWGAALAGLARALVRTRGRARRDALVIALWLLGPAVQLCAFQALTGSPGVVSRYWLFSLPALAIGAGYAFDLRSRASQVLGVALAVGLACAGWPSQATVRSVDGHLGQGWALVPRVLALPQLRSAPLLTGSWNYHGLVANHPDITARLPLVRDPDPSGRVVPQLWPPGSPAFAGVVHAHDRVVVLGTVRHAGAAIPSARAFGAYRGDLRAFPHLAVACAWFDQALAVFTVNRDVLSAGDEQRLRGELVAIAPREIRCAVPDATVARG